MDESISIMDCSLIHLWKATLTLPPIFDCCFNMCRPIRRRQVTLLYSETLSAAISTRFLNASLLVSTRYMPDEISTIPKLNSTLNL